MADFKELPPGHDASAHKDVVGREMHHFKRGELHSGRGKGGKPGKIVKNPKQAIAIALSIAGKSKKGKTSDHAERLMSMGYTEAIAKEVASMLEFADFDWQRQFETGKGPRTGGQLESGPSDRHHPKELVGEKDTRTKRSGQEMLSPVQYPKGPGNPQGGSSKEVFGLRAFGEGTQQAEPPTPCPPKRPEEPKPPQSPQPPQPPRPPQPPQPVTAAQQDPSSQRQKKKKCTPQPTGQQNAVNHSEVLDFTRCQRPDGTIYGSPGKCRQGVEIGAKEKAEPKQGRKMRLTAKIKAMSAADLKKVAADPRLSEKQRSKLQELIAEKEARGTTTAASKIARPLAKKAEGSTEESPKYDKTPGSRSPIAKPTGGRSSTRSPSLKKIYKEQGFNAKPELVGTTSDLQNRKDILTHGDGSPMILYRGVTTKEFSDQFKGLGDEGGTHFPGKGIYGNGTYAATVHASEKWKSDNAILTAVGYSGLPTNDEQEVNRRVTAFALRKDANVVTFKGVTSRATELLPSTLRKQEYNTWCGRVIREAEKETGYKYKDVGEAAAALGIHAYQVPQGDQDYWVILNRGAVIAAVNPELPSRLLY